MRDQTHIFHGSVIVLGAKYLVVFSEGKRAAKIVAVEFHARNCDLENFLRLSAVFQTLTHENAEFCGGLESVFDAVVFSGANGV